MSDIDLPYWKKDLNDRNRPFTDEELDQILPSVGYEVSLLVNSNALFFRGVSEDIQN